MRISDWSSDVCSSDLQHAFAEMLDAEPEHYEQLGAFYEAKRDRFREQLLGTKFRPLPVPGGYFQLADYSAVSDLDDFEFCRWLTIEKGVTAAPLSPFYETPPPEIGRASGGERVGQYV